MMTVIDEIWFQDSDIALVLFCNFSISIGLLKRCGSTNGMTLYKTIDDF